MMTTDAMSNGRSALISNPEYLGKLIAYWSRRNDALGLPAIEHDPTRIDLLDGYRRELAEQGEDALIMAMAQTLYDAIQVKRARIQEIKVLITEGKVSLEKARTLLHEADTIQDDIKEMADALEQIEEGVNRGS